jgi:hypothetical protein
MYEVFASKLLRTYLTVGSNPEREHQQHGEVFGLLYEEQGFQNRRPCIK